MEENYAELFGREYVDHIKDKDKSKTREVQNKHTQLYDYFFSECSEKRMTRRALKKVAAISPIYRPD